MLCILNEIHILIDFKELKERLIFLVIHTLIQAFIEHMYLPDTMLGMKYKNE